MFKNKNEDDDYKGVQWKCLVVKITVNVLINYTVRIHKTITSYKRRTAPVHHIRFDAATDDWVWIISCTGIRQPESVE